MRRTVSRSFKKRPSHGLHWSLSGIIFLSIELMPDRETNFPTSRLGQFHEDKDDDCSAQPSTRDLAASSFPLLQETETGRGKVAAARERSSDASISFLLTVASEGFLRASQRFIFSFLSKAGSRVRSASSRFLWPHFLDPNMWIWK